MRKFLNMALSLLLWTVPVIEMDARQVVRNVIYMIGDGMGLSHMSMFEIEGGYSDHAFKRAQSISLISTMSANNRVTDSAAAGTALSSGYKTNNAMIGMRPDSTTTVSMMEMAVNEGFSTGIVVTSELYHATPATFYAHQPKRKMYEEISEDMLNSSIDVLLGGGDLILRKPFKNYTYLDHFAQKGYEVVHTMETLEGIGSGKVIGTFAKKSMPKAFRRGDYLPRAMTSALRILEANSADKAKGFMLMVEGSKIDGAAQSNDVAATLAEVVDFEKAVAIAFDYADAHPGTLVVVVGDHETGGLSAVSGNSDFTAAESGIEYKFSTKAHSAVRVPAYFYGTGADGFKAMMDNTELAFAIMKAAGLKKEEVNP